MSDNHQRRLSADPMDKIIDDMAAELRIPEGQYIPMGFSTQKNLNWGPQPSASSYLNYPIHYQVEPQHVEPIPNYIHENNAMFEPSVMFHQKNINFPDYDAYNGNSQPVFNNYQTPVMSDGIIQENLTPNVSHQTPIFTNWNLSNNATGTYSPFGTSATFKPTLFDFQVENDENSLDDKTRFKIQQSDFNNKFNFNKDVRKPRPLAEVKPMRPSYSDVLTKSVPPANNIKSIKTEMKDIKFKNSSRKNGKPSKAGSVLNRTNTSNEIIKDLPHLATSKSDKKPLKLHQSLNRKWNSLDNLAEPVSAKGDEPKKIIKKSDDSFAKTLNNKNKGKFGKNANLTEEILDDSIQAEPINSIKNVSKKNKLSTSRSKHDAHGSGSEKSSSKRMQRNRRKEEQPIIDLINEKAKLYIKHWWKVINVFFTWLFNVISDVCSLSVHLGGDFLVNASSQLISLWKSCICTTEIILKRFKLTAYIFEKFETKFKEKPKKSKFEEETTNSFLQNGLETNISMPTTGEEAMKRLLACKGKDPYSILGVTPKCSDDDIKKYYKRQAFLVHPDKNNQPGAEEAFKILVHAFDMIGTPEHRTIYDRGVAESAFVVQNFSQMAELLQQLQQKMEMNANTIRCSVCNDRHKRIKIDRPSYAARNCKTCKIHHAAREGDIWAEAKCFGFLWHYYACMEGSVYDITDWAGCQKETLKHLKPDTHHVQYRIALGKQQTNNNNNNNNVNNSNNLPRRNSQIPKTEKPDLENLLNSLYGHDVTTGTTNKRKNKNRK